MEHNFDWYEGYNAYNNGDNWDNTKSEEWKKGFMAAHKHFMENGHGYVPMKGRI